MALTRSRILLRASGAITGRRRGADRPEQPPKTGETALNTKTESERQIADLIEECRIVAARGDVDTIANFYAEDARLLPPNAVSAQGPDSAAQMWRSMLSLPNVALSWKPARIEAAASGDLAYVVGTYSLGFDANGTRKEDRGKYVAIWRRVGGSWKIAVDIINSDLPAV